MSNCIRNNIFNEKHKCFKINCNTSFYPSKNDTCLICNWKKCNNNHCGCSLNKETFEVLNKFYNLFCNINNYSKDTIYSLKIMFETYYNNCFNNLK